jgi:hypothetical protein
MKKNKYIIAIFLILTIIGCEETKIETVKYGSLQGTILDGESYAPIEGVLVATNPASSTSLTGSNGIFEIEKVIKGDVIITAHKNDYLSSSISVAVYEDDITSLTFFLLKDERNVGWIDIYDPVPGNGAVNMDSTFTMQWKVDQQYPSKELVYTVYYFVSNSTTQFIAGENLTAKEVVIDDFKFGTTYFWYVVARYEGERVANSPTWSFKTKPSAD